MNKITLSIILYSTINLFADACIPIDNKGSYCCNLKLNTEYNCSSLTSTPCKVENGVIEGIVAKCSPPTHDQCTNTNKDPIAEFYENYKITSAFIVNPVESCNLANIRIQSFPTVLLNEKVQYRNESGIPSQLPKVDENYIYFYKAIKTSQLESIKRSGLEPKCGGIGGASHAAGWKRDQIALLDSGRQYFAADLTSVEQFAELFEKGSEDSRVATILKIAIPIKEALAFGLVHRRDPLNPTSLDEWFVTQNIPPRYISYASNFDISALHLGGATGKVLVEEIKKLKKAEVTQELITKMIETQEKQFKPLIP